jgi:gluconokinase
MIIIVMGVSGCGKSAVGKALAEKLSYPFYDGDDFHSEANKAKMVADIPLTDEDRFPWLETLAELMRETDEMVLACSALKESYRKILNIGPQVRFVYLKGDPHLIRKRMEARKGHYFKADLLDSQLEALEEPKDALIIDIKPSVAQIVENILLNPL